MLISAELRWFWKDAPPSGLESWFRSGSFPPGGGILRRDEYLLDPSQTELGLKKRGGGSGVEVKGLIGFGTTIPGPFAARVQLWAKWASKTVSIDHLPRIVAAKTRWVRKFDTTTADIRELVLDASEQPKDRSTSPPECGCLIEFVDIQLGDAQIAWWGLAFEAFGPLDSVQESLRRTTERVAHPTPPSLEGGFELSYPEWFSRCALQA
jgi:hypothetical protein